MESQGTPTASGSSGNATPAAAAAATATSSTAASTVSGAMDNNNDIDTSTPSAAATISATTATTTASAGTTSAGTSDTSAPTSSEGGADEDAEEDDIFKETKARFDEEWKSVRLEHHIGGKQGGKAMVFNHMRLVKLKKRALESEFYKTSKVLQKIHDEEGEVMVCLLCQEEKKELCNCLQKFKNRESSNLTTHVKRCHAKQLAKLKAAEEAKKRKKKTQTPNSKATSQKRGQSSLDSFATAPTSAKKKKTAHKKEAVETLHRKISRFVTKKGLPDLTVTDEALRDAFDYAIENAHDLKGVYKHLGIRKHITIECNDFASFISDVTALVQEVRQWWVEKTGARQEFITVAHDVWDGKRKQLNGLTIFFIHPETLVLYRIPIALTPPLGKKAIELCKTCMHGLERIGVEFLDCVRAVNDNCTTARKAGRLVVGGGKEAMIRRAEEVNGSCDMHYANLMAGLALSLVQRRENGRVVNRWAPFMDLHEKTKNAAKYVCDKQFKRFDDYSGTIGSHLSQDVIMITLGNGTRVSTALLLGDGMLRSMHALLFYGTKNIKFEDKNLRRSEWKQLAEFNAIMRKAHLLCFDVQTDRPEGGAEVILLLSHLKVHYEENDEWDVVDTSRDWPASTPFNDLPTIKMTSSREKAGAAGLPLMSDSSIELIGRYVNSYNEYFGNDMINGDRLLAMIVNPFLGTVGFEELKVLRDDGEELFTRAKTLLRDAITKFTRTMKSPGSTTEQQPAEGNGAPASSSGSRLERLAALRAQRSKTTLTNNNSGWDEAVAKAISAYLQQDFNAEKELRAQCKRMQKDESEYDWEKVKAGNLFYISSKFDSLEWWKKVGSKEHSLVFLVALIIIALPPSNGFQERIFSACTWIDDPLRQRLQPKRFEMNVLLAVNQALLKDGVLDEKDAKKIVEKVIEIFDGDGDQGLNFIPSLDLGLNANTDDFRHVDSDEDV